MRRARRNALETDVAGRLKRDPAVRVGSAPCVETKSHGTKVPSPSRTYEYAAPKHVTESASRAQRLSWSEAPTEARPSRSESRGFLYKIGVLVLSEYWYSGTRYVGFGQERARNFG